MTQGGQVEDRTYNTLNQLTSIRKGSQIYTNYNYNSWTNNGQMASMQDRANGTATAYTYDSLKRLAATKTTKFPTVTNPSFESVTIPGWPGNGLVSSTAHAGLYGLELTNGLQVQQSFNCAAACGTPTTYTMSGYVQTTGSTSALFITVTGNQSFQAFKSSGPSSAWAAFSFQFTTPSGFTGGLSVALTTSSNTTTPVYVDDLSITAGGSNLLTNGGFESGASPTNWLGGATATDNVHSGTLSAILQGSAPANAISQTVTGLSASTSYNVGVWYNLLAGCTLTLNAGGTAVQSTTSGSWQFLYGTWTSSPSGTLPVSISVGPAGGGVILDDVTISGGPASPTVTQSETFGFDGFGNLLSQTPTAGSGPMMSLNVDPHSNTLIGQGNYDSAGNFLGNSQYSYDILNRLAATNQHSYIYSPGSNKRMAVYSSSGTTAAASFNIYDPNGRKMGVYNYTATAPWSEPAQVQYTHDIPYLGSKRIDVSEDQVGSNWDQTQYYPWGQVQAGQQPSETQGFGTYVLDGGSGLYYADQRYYNQNWGRFLTPDPSDANINPANPGSWNRYAYTGGNPINAGDPTGTCAANYSGICDGGCTAWGNCGQALPTNFGDMNQAEANYVAGTVVPAYIQSAYAANPVLTDPALTQYFSPGPNTSSVISYGNFSEAATAVISALQLLFPGVTGGDILQIPSGADYLQISLTAGPLWSIGTSVTVDKFGDVFISVPSAVWAFAPYKRLRRGGYSREPKHQQQPGSHGWMAKRVQLGRVRRLLGRNRVSE